MLLHICFVNLLLISKVTLSETAKLTSLERILQVHWVPLYVEFTFNSAVDHTTVSLLIISFTVLILPQFHIKRNLEFMFAAKQMNVTMVPDMTGTLPLMYIVGEGKSTNKLYKIVL